MDEGIPAECEGLRNSLHVSKVLDLPSTQEEASYFSPSLNLYSWPSYWVGNCARACVFTSVYVCFHASFSLSLQGKGSSHSPQTARDRSHLAIAKQLIKKMNQTAFLNSSQLFLVYCVSIM